MYDGITYNGSGGDTHDHRWERICERMNKMLSNLERYGYKINRMNLSDKEKKVRLALSIVGAGVAGANILVQEGGQDYMSKIMENLVEARMNKDGVYTGLIDKRTLSPEVIKDVRDHPLAIKARRICEIGESNIIKILESREK